MAVLDEARQLVESRLAAIDEEKARLERALKELGGNAKRRGLGRPNSSTNRAGTSNEGVSRRRGPRTGPGRLQQVLEHFHKDPTSRTKDVAAGIGISTNAVSGLKKEARVRGLAEDGPNGELIVKGTQPPGGDAGKRKAPATPDTSKRSGRGRRGGKGKRRSKKAAGRADAAS
jgi:hypothetical protein